MSTLGTDPTGRTLTPPADLLGIRPPIIRRTAAVAAVLWWCAGLLGAAAAALLIADPLGGRGRATTIATAGFWSFALALLGTGVAAALTVRWETRHAGDLGDGRDAHP